jgi:hypothetical protein
MLPEFTVTDPNTHFERSVRERNKRLEIVPPLKLAPHTDVERIVSTLQQRGAVSLGLAEKLAREKWEVVPFEVDEQGKKQLIRD